MENSKYNKTDWQPLLSYQRSGITEVVKFGALSWVSGKEMIHEVGGNPLCFGRSLMKPWQMKGLVNDLDGELNTAQKALSLASHNAELRQIDCAQSILPTSDHPRLNTPACMPLMPNTEVTTPSQWNHPCSGKHAAIIRACQLNGWSQDDYQSDTHPYHSVFLGAIRAELGQDWQPQAVAVDGCGLPTFSQTVSEMAQLFASLVTTKQDDWIWQTMVENPELIGGKSRLDTAIMKAGNGKVLAKEGADGLLGMAIEHADHPQGLGVVIKLSHGWDGAATGFIAANILNSLGITFDSPPPPDGQTVHLSALLCPK